MKLNHWLAQMSSPSRRRRRHVACNKQGEVLENRALLTVITEFDAAIGELEVESNAGDTIVVSSSATGDDVLVNGNSTGLNPADVKKLEVKGGPLANRLDISAVTDEVFTSLVEVEVKGNGGNDTIIGSEFNDELSGGAGDDSVDGHAGDDHLKGEDGEDSLNGGEGNDTLRGHDGDDSLDGEAGDDSLNGGLNHDSVLGGDGDDSVTTGRGHDSIEGGAGDDNIRSGDGRDSVMGGDDDDTILGQNGRDDVSGGSGNDTLKGGRGPDRITGDAGSDRVLGGSSDDLLKGGEDDDTLNGGSGDDILDGDEGDDNEKNGFSTDIESTFFAAIDGVNGKAKFEQDVDGDIELEFELEVEDAPEGSYTVSVDGTNIGTLEVNSFGNGRIEYSTQPDDPGEQQMPSNFPEISDGSVITIDGLGSGTFGQFNDVELEGELSPIGNSDASGEVKFEADGLEREFEFEAEDLEPGTYDLIIDGVVVATFDVTDDELEIEWEEDEEGSNFPENFPELSDGSIVELEGVLSGVLSNG